MGKKEIMKKFLKIGEFARLCKTTRDTLLHYARKGFIRPRHTAANGYRYYSMDQFWEFNMLSLLKETGSSLSEIKEAGKRPGSEAYVDLLKTKLELLIKRRDDFSKRIDMFDNLLQLTEEAISAPRDMLMETIPPICLIRYYKVDTKASFNLPSPEIYSSSFKNYISEEYSYPPLGMAIDYQHVKSGKFIIDYIFSDSKEANTDYAVTLPKGKYLSWYHCGNMESHVICYKKLLERIIADGESPKGNMLIFDQMNYLISTSDNEFIGKYMIYVV